MDTEFEPGTAVQEPPTIGAGTIKPKRKRQSKGPYTECKTCHKRFYGPRRNAKLGSHRFAAHIKGKKQGAIAAQPFHVEVMQFIESYNQLSPAAQAVVDKLFALPKL